MKIFILTCFAMATLKIDAQEKICGNYHDYFGIELKINSDSTFEYERHFDISSQWAKGKWKIDHDTISFIVLPSYDSVKIDDKMYLKSEVFTEEQNIRKLYYHKKKLFRIDKNGEINRKRYKAWPIKRRIFRYKKSPSWYIEDDK